MKSFWTKLVKPFVGLAPMDGVTDYPCRAIQKKYGQPDLVYTEFVSAEGLARGAKALAKTLKFDEAQRPIVAQLFGITPDDFYTSAQMIVKLGFDGVDINMGCPAKNVADHGAGAALIKNRELAQEIIAAVKKGVNGKIPVSVKTRLGYFDQEIKTWIPFLLEQKIDALAVHGRTLKQYYGGEADWQAIGEVVKMAEGSGTLIIGNGDVKSRSEAEKRAELAGVDGVLIGRAALGNPWVFQPNYQADQIDPLERARVALAHARLYEQAFSNDPKYHFLPMRKHLAWYIKGVAKASEIRSKLVETNSAAEVIEIFREYKLI